MIFLINHNNFLGQKIEEKFQAKNIAGKSFKEEYLEEENTFIFNSILNDEIVNEINIENILFQLDKTFTQVQQIIKILLKNQKKAKFIFITTNSKLNNIVNFHYAPIYEESIYAFVKSLTKEFNPFKLSFNALALEPIAEMIEKDDKKNYRRKMKNIALRKTPTKIEDFLVLLDEIIHSKSKLLSGTVLSVGEGLFV